MRNLRIVKYPKYEIPSWSNFENTEVIKDSEMYALETTGHMITAYAIFNVNSDTYLADVGTFLHKLEVREKHRGKGYGKKLIQFLIERYENIWFEPRNSSHNFYLKLGAKPFATHCKGWLFAFSNRLPTENWKLFVKDNVNFCEQPDNDFVYNPEDWDMKMLDMLG